jgi:hypothetical protein
MSPEQAYHGGVRRQLCGLVVTAMVGLAAIAGASLVNVSVSPQYGEIVVGLRSAPNVCADLIVRGDPTFYVGTECDY